MEDLNEETIFPKASLETRRQETERAFATIVAEERRARLAKTMRLKSMRLLKQE